MGKIKQKKKVIKNVRQSTKQLVFNKSDGFCARCGKSFSQFGVKGTIDHVVPKAEGGADELDNYIPLCYECNQAKRDTLVYPPFYYYQLNYDEECIQKAGAMTLEMLNSIVTRDYINKNPMLFDELLFSIKSWCKARIFVSLGWANKHAYINFCDRVDIGNSLLQDVEGFDINNIVNKDSVYVCYEAKEREVQAIFDVAVEDNNIIINSSSLSNRNLNEIINSISISTDDIFFSYSEGDWGTLIN